MSKIEEMAKKYAEDMVDVRKPGRLHMYYRKGQDVFSGYDIENAYDEGANYVLEQIEKLTNNQNWCAFPKQSHKELKELIEQLKK